MFWKFGTLNIFQNNSFNWFSKTLQKRFSIYDWITLFPEKMSLFGNCNELNNAIKRKILIYS